MGIRLPQRLPAPQRFVHGCLLGVRAVTMTMKVYRLGPDGERQTVSDRTTDGVPLAVVAQGYPPCACPRCVSRRSPVRRERRTS